MGSKGHTAGEIVAELRQVEVLTAHDQAPPTRSSVGWLEMAKSGSKYAVRTCCPQCARKHITVFRLRHVSDSFFVHLGHFFRYARHFDFQRLRWCTNSGQHPNWGRSQAAPIDKFSVS